MNKPTKIRSSAAVRQDISRLDPCILLTHGRSLFAQRQYASLRKICLHELTAHKGAVDLTNFDNQGTAVAAWVQTDRGKEMAIAAATITALESSDTYAEAQEKLVPLLAELEIAEKAEAEHAAEVGAAMQAVREAEEAAKEKALAAATEDPELAKARKKLEAVSS